MHASTPIGHEAGKARAVGVPLGGLCPVAIGVEEAFQARGSTESGAERLEDMIPGSPEHPIDAAVAAGIVGRLPAIEDQYGVRVLYACE